MRRLAAALTVAMIACGDPVVILGDLPGSMRRIAGTAGIAGTAVSDSVAVDMLLSRPEALAADAAGRVYLADGRPTRISEIGSDGRVRVLLDPRECGSGCPRSVGDMALDGAGRLVLADPNGHRVWLLDPESGVLVVLAGTGSQGLVADGAFAVEAPLSLPSGVAVGAAGEVYFSERGAHRVRRIDADGRLATVVGSAAAEPVSGELVSPAGLAFAAGLLYIAEAGASRVRALDVGDGRLHTVAGAGVAGFAGDRGPAAAAYLRFPIAVDISTNGRSLYIADTGNHRIRRVDLSTGLIQTLVGTGSTVLPEPELSAGATSLESPEAVAASPFGFLYIGSTGHHVVWRTNVGS